MEFILKSMLEPVMESCSSASNGVQFFTNFIFFFFFFFHLSRK